MPIIKITKEEIKRGFTIAAGWYDAELIKYSTEPAKLKPGKSASLNYVYVFKVDDSTDEGKEIKHTFNSGAITMMIPFYEAATGEKVVTDPHHPEDFEFDTDDIEIGTKFKVEVIVDTWEGRLNNKIKTFLSANAKTPF